MKLSLVDSDLLRRLLRAGSTAQDTGIFFSHLGKENSALLCTKIIGQRFSIVSSGRALLPLMGRVTGKQHRSFRAKTELLDQGFLQDGLKRKISQRAKGAEF